MVQPADPEAGTVIVPKLTVVPATKLPAFLSPNVAESVVPVVVPIELLKKLKVKLDTAKMFENDWPKVEPGVKVNALPRYAGRVSNVVSCAWTNDGSAGSARRKLRRSSGFMAGWGELPMWPRVICKQLYWRDVRKDNAGAITLRITARSEAAEAGSAGMETVRS